MTNEELFERINQRFIDEREVTRNIVQEETRRIVQEETEPMKKDIKILDRRSKKANKLLNFVAKFYDKEVSDLRKRVKNIEEHIGISNSTGLL